MWCRYIIGVGFCVARFTTSGNARASSCGTSDMVRSPRFFVYGINYLIKNVWFWGFGHTQNLKFMKKNKNLLWVLLVSLISIPFTSCSSDDGGETVTLSTDKTSLYFSSNADASNEFKIISNSEWSITCPDWINISSKSGNGDAVINVTTKTRNASGVERSSDLVISASGKTATVLLVQEPLYANCTVNIKNELIMSQGFYGEYVFSDNVAGLFDVCFDKSIENEYTDEELYNHIITSVEPTSKDEAEDFAYGNIEPETDCLLCIIPYTIVDGMRKYGPMTKKYYTTKASTISSDAIITYVNYTSALWKFNVQKYSKCARYYMVSLESYIPAYYASSGFDIILAQLTRELIEEGEIDYHTNDGAFSISRSQDASDFTIWTWGVNDKGEFSSNISWNYKTTDNYYNSVLNNNKQKEQFENIKMSKTEYNTLKNSIKVIELK